MSTLTRILMFAALPVFALETQAQTIVIDPVRPPSPIPRPVPPDRPVPSWRDVPLSIEKQSLDVSITDGAAVTKVDQTFKNLTDRRVEGSFIFPLEREASVSKFTMTVNGQEVEGELLGVDEARRLYESIVSQTRDPALLEYLGTRMFRARIFPIDPKGEARVSLTYTQLLRGDNGLVRFRHLMSAGQSTNSTIGQFSAVVRIESATPIKSVFSPTHSMAVQRTSDYKASASYEAADEVCDRHFELFYSLARQDFGLTILGHRLEDEDGFFLARIAPPAVTDPNKVMPKDIAFVIDTSGSMSGGKLDQAKRAMEFCLSNLNEKDRFNIVAFSHEPRPFREGLVSASSENVTEARNLVQSLRPTGGTNIHDAILSVLAAAPESDDARPFYVVFLTDGLPTIGVTNPTEILKSIAAKNAVRTRLFAFGVGYDVNSDFLDLLAEQNRGTREYVVPGEDLELKLSSFYRKVADPVLADVKLLFGKLDVYDLMPAALGDLFAGSEIVVTGRYKGDGSQAVELQGTRGGKPVKFIEEARFPKVQKEYDFVARLWATRKIGFLLDQIRLHGEDKELKDSIVELATEYGIITPYTAYLVTEPGSVARRLRPQAERMAQAVGQSDDQDLNRVVREEAKMAMAPAPPASEIAASKAMRGARIGASRGAQTQQATEAASVQSYTRARVIRDASGRTQVQSAVRHVGRRAFYQIGSQWVESAYDAGRQKTQDVKLFSDEYFALLRNHPDLAECFALGEEVVVVAGGTAYQTVR